MAAISGITPDGRLFQMVREQAVHGEEEVVFLRHLLNYIPSTLPGHAPDRNADEAAGSTPSASNDARSVATT